MTADAVVAACGATLEPLETAANAAWWDANIDASDETQRRRADADIALSDALADADAFAEVRAAQAEPRPRSRSSPASSRCSCRASRPNQVDADLRREIVELQSDIESRFARHRGDDRRQSRSTTTRSSRCCARATTTRTAGPRGRRRRASAPRSRPTCASWPGSATTRPGRSGTATTSRSRSRRPTSTRSGCSPRSPRSTSSPRPRSATLEGGARRTARGPLRSRRRRAAPVALRRPVLPGRARARSASTSIRISRDADLEALTVRTFDSMGLDVARRARAQRPHAPRRARSQHAFCIDVDRVGDVRVLSNNTPGRALGRDDAARVRPRRVLRRRRAASCRGCCARCTSASPKASRCAAAASSAIPSGSAGSRASRRRRSPSSRRGSRAASRAYLLVFARWVLVMTHFERGLYARARRRPRHPLVGSRRALPTRAPARRPATRPTGPRRSTSRPRPSTTTTTCSARWSRRSSRAALGGLVDNRGRGPRVGAHAVRAGRDACAGIASSSTRPVRRSRPPCSRATSRADGGARDVRHAVRPHRRRRCCSRRTPTVIPTRPRSSSGTPPRAAGGELHTQYLTIDDHGAYAFLGSRPDVAVGRRARRQRARRRDRQREDLDRRPSRQRPAPGAPRDGSRAARPRTRPFGRRRAHGHHRRCSSGTGRAAPASRTATSRTTRRSSSPTARGGFVIETSNRTWAARPVDARRRDLESHQPRAPTGRARRPTSRPAPTSTTTGGRACPPSIADDRLAVTRAVVARGAATTPRDDSRGRCAATVPAATPTAPGRRRRRRRAASRVCMHRRESHSQTTASMIAELRADGRAARVGVPRQSVRERLRAVLPARGRARARRRRRSGTGSPGSATRSRPNPDRLAAGPRRARRGRGRAVGRRRRRVRHRATRARLDAFAADGVRTGRRRATSTRRLTTHYGRPGVSRAGAGEPCEPVEFNVADLLRAGRRHGARSSRPRLRRRGASPTPSSTRGRTGSRTCCSRTASAPATTSRSTSTTRPSTSKACSPRSRSARFRSTSTTATSKTSCSTSSTTPTRSRSCSTAEFAPKLDGDPAEPAPAPDVHRGRRRQPRPPGDALAARSTTSDALAAASPARDFAPAVRRRPVPALHRRHDRHAEGRDVAPRRPVLRRHGRRRRRRRADRTPEEIAERCLQPRTRCVPICPFMHGTAHWMAFSTLFMGGSVIIPDRAPPRPARGVAARRARAGELHRHRRRRVRAPAARRARLCRPAARSTSRACTSCCPAARSSRPSLKRAFVERLPALLVVDGYGASETGGQGQSVVVAGGDVPTAPRFRVGDDTQVLGPDLRPVGVGVVGRLARRGHIPLGYYKDAAKTAATFPVVDGVRWAVPGDHAVVETDGTITLLGRGSVSINTGGEKVYPEEVESVLKAHADVFDAVVVGVPDERWGERVVAIVQAAPGRPHRSLDALQEHSRAHLAGYKVPREIVLVDAIERSPSGQARLPLGPGVAADDARVRSKRDREPARRRDEPVPPPTRRQSRRLDAVGRRSVRARTRARRARLLVGRAIRRATGAT